MGKKKSQRFIFYSFFGLNEVRVKVSPPLLHTGKVESVQSWRRSFPFFPTRKKNWQWQSTNTHKVTLSIFITKKTFLLNSNQKILELSTIKIRTFLVFLAVQKTFYSLKTFLFLCRQWKILFISLQKISYFKLHLIEKNLKEFSRVKKEFAKFFNQ